MTTQAKIGYGVAFKIGNGAVPELFTTVAEVTDIKPPNWSRDSVDATHNQSPDGHREFILGLADGGEVSFDVNFVPGSATTLLLMAEKVADMSNKQIIFPNGEIMTFRAGCTGFEPTAPIDDKMAATVTYKVSGTVTLS